MHHTSRASPSVTTRKATLIVALTLRSMLLFNHCNLNHTRSRSSSCSSHSQGRTNNRNLHNRAISHNSIHRSLRHSLSKLHGHHLLVILILNLSQVLLLLFLQLLTPRRVLSSSLNLSIILSRHLSLFLLLLRLEQLRGRTHNSIHRRKRGCCHVLEIIKTLLSQLFTSIMISLLTN